MNRYVSCIVKSKEKGISTFKLTMDWKRCIIWQKATGENLQCPANSQRRDAGASYVSLSLNISTILSSKPFVLRRFQWSLNTSKDRSSDVRPENWLRYCCSFVVNFPLLEIKEREREREGEKERERERNCKQPVMPKTSIRLSLFLYLLILAKILESSICLNPFPALILARSNFSLRWLLLGKQ